MSSSLLLGYSIEFENLQREYFVIHASSWNANTNTNNNNKKKKSMNSNHGDVIVLLHPFHGTPEHTFQRSIFLIEAGFDLIIPTGIEKSWNGGECCGEAKRLKLNDVGFINAIVQEYFVNTAKQVQAFVTGYSNGGFLTSRLLLKAATNNSTNPYRWVRGGAMVAGEIFDRDEYFRPVSFDKIPIPVMIIHSKNDLSVQYNGCCQESNPPCCCDIISLTSCSSVNEIFHRWQLLNDCNENREMYPVQVNGANKTIITCKVAMGCDAPTILCPFQTESHRGSPQMFHLVQDFFCSLSGGKCTFKKNWKEISQYKSNMGDNMDDKLTIDDDDRGNIDAGDNAGSILNNGNDNNNDDIVVITNNKNEYNLNEIIFMIVMGIVVYLLCWRLYRFIVLRWNIRRGGNSSSNDAGQYVRVSTNPAFVKQHLQQHVQYQ
jgi:poly(3-hydroxybutyrate) depolymerase